MFQAFTRTLLRRYQAAAMVLVVGTVAGWSLFSGSRGLTVETERQSSAPAAAFPAGQRPTLPEWDKAQSLVTQVPDSSMSSGFAQNELPPLAQEKVWVQQPPVPPRPPLRAVPPAGGQPQTGPLKAGLVARNPPPPPQAPARRVRVAQTE